MKPLHISRAVFDVTVCEIRGVRLRVPLRARASACTSEWHSSPPPSTATTLPRAVSLSPGSPVVHDHPSAPVIRWFQTVALTSRCGSFWKVLFGVMWETETRGRVSVGRCVCVCVCTAENITNMFCPFRTVCCLSSVLVACQPQRVRSMFWPSCKDRSEWQAPSDGRFSVTLIPLSLETNTVHGSIMKVSGATKLAHPLQTG